MTMIPQQTDSLFLVCRKVKNAAVVVLSAHRTSIRAERFLEGIITETKGHPAKDYFIDEWIIAP